MIEKYFIPISKFNEFIYFLKKVKPLFEKTLMNITVRHLKKDNSAVLRYANQDNFAFVFLFRGTYEKIFDDIIRAISVILTNKALDLSGSYYSSYRPYETKKQFIEAYRKGCEFMKIKETYDPNFLFINNFYNNYLNATGANTKGAKILIL